MNEMDRDRTFTNSRRDALHISGADVANRENRRQARLKHLWRAVERPLSRCVGENGIQVPPRENEALLIKLNTATQPVTAG